MEQTELANSLNSARLLKEMSHSDGDPMIPIVELVRDDEVIAIIGMAEFNDYEEKVERWTECLYAVRSMECDGVRLIIDAHMSRVDAGTYDPDNFTMPSQDPKAVDVILAYEWKDGTPTEALCHEYHIQDDGVLRWEELVDFPVDAIESWMNERVAWAYQNPRPTVKSIDQLGVLLSGEGHIFALRGGPNAGR